ncbi:hypothetical protein PSYPI_49592, partial [Pseudomonas syringae pv. pisi str. 1704B]
MKVKRDPACSVCGAASVQGEQPLVHALVDGGTI